MRKLLPALLLLISIRSASQTPVFSWAKQIDGDVFISASMSDAAGSLYLTGSFAGTVDFDPGATVNAVTEAGFGDIFISKMDSLGNLLWVRHIGNASYDEGRAISTDLAGNIYIAGFFNSDSVDFDPGPGVFMMNATENSFLLKLDANGNFIWAKQLSGVSQNYATSVKLDHQDNIIITGKFEGTADFDPNAGTHNLTAFASDIYIWKLDNGGNFIWAKQLETLSSGTRSYSIATDNAQNIYISGLLAGSTDFDPGAGVFNLSNTSIGGAAFILKLNNQGDFAWAKKIENTDINLSTERLVADMSGNMYLGGAFTGTADFDPDAGVQNLTASAGNDHFLLKLNNNGAFSWVKQMPDVKGIFLDNSGNIYTCGNTINQFDGNGATLWTSNNSLSSRITVSSSGIVYTSGAFSGTVDFDPGAAVYNLTSTGSSSTFIQQMKQAPVLGLENPELHEGSFMVYPNPANGAVYIQSSTQGTFLLTNGFGQIVRTVTVQPGKPVLIDTGGLPDGLYFISNRQRGKTDCGSFMILH